MLMTLKKAMSKGDNRSLKISRMAESVAKSSFGRINNRRLDGSDNNSAIGRIVWKFSFVCYLYLNTKQTITFPINMIKYG